MNNNTRIAQGFTLIELLLAIAIFSLVSLASFSIVDSAISASEKSDQRISRLNELNRAFLVMERDFVQLSLRTMRINGEAPQSTFLHIDSQGVFSDATALAFVRSGWTNPGLLLPRSDLEPVAYQLNDDALERLSFNFVDSTVGQAPKKRILIQGVEQLAFQFYINQTWETRFDGDTLPQAIAVIVTIEDVGEVRREFLLPTQAASRSASSSDSAGGKV